ncbi:MAG: hypothetical protein HN904_01785 [Victivallales bacterium]|nr:hypothetical protein [Victivallales bacterium]
MKNTPCPDSVFGQEGRRFYGVADGLPSLDVRRLCVGKTGDLIAVTAAGASRLKGDRWHACATPGQSTVPHPGPTGAGAIRAALPGPTGTWTVAAEYGLFRLGEAGQWSELRPTDERRSWWVRDARAVACGPDGCLWVALPAAVACLRQGTWALYEGRDGLPCGDLTCIAVAPDGTAWFGSSFGLARFDGEHWTYRQGQRWLPDDDVRDIAVTDDGSAWVAMAKGVCHLSPTPMTLARKAGIYEQEIDRHHRRTEYGYVLEVHVPTAGHAEDVLRRDSDNDGLWTGMYGAGECFAYAVTSNDASRRRARQAWEALRFLGTVTQGGEPTAEPGFVARTVRPAEDDDPNATEYTPEKDRKMRAGRDREWKSLAPRWPRSADGKWFWKADTSSDELDGHFFFYALYHDLVADTAAEKQAVREHACAIVDHLLHHGGNYVDHDGQVTRWGVFSPDQLNDDPLWFPERGLNCLSLLSYLAVAHHLSGDDRYRDAGDRFVRQHHYLQNLMVTKIQNGPGSGNQSDDEMAFMAFYGLIQFTHDEQVREMAAVALHRYWLLERPERNPLFNFIHAVCCRGRAYQTPFARVELGPSGASLDEAIDTLRRLPLDRFNWAHTNSHRLDTAPLPATSYLLGDTPRSSRGHRLDGTVVPVDECHFNHWNYDPWQLDTGGDGRTLADGAVFTLPYYLGRYHGLIGGEGTE